MSKRLVVLLAGLALAALLGNDAAWAKNWNTDSNQKKNRNAVNIAYFLEWATPNQISKVEKLYEKAMGVKVNWIDFQTGIKMSKAMQNGKEGLNYADS